MAQLYPKPIDPPLRTCKGLLALAGVSLIVLAEWVDHRFLMDLPMPLHHALRLAADGLLLVIVAATFSLVLRYENKLAALNAELLARTQALEQLKSTVDERVVSLAQRLAFSLASVTSKSQLAMQRTSDVSNIKAFSQVIDEAHDLSDITHQLLDIKQLVPVSKQSDECYNEAR